VSECVYAMINHLGKNVEASLFGSICPSTHPAKYCPDHCKKKNGSICPLTDLAKKGGNTAREREGWGEMESRGKERERESAGVVCHTYYCICATVIH
jgi:hypothetical protein